MKNLKIKNWLTGKEDEIDLKSVNLFMLKILSEGFIDEIKIKVHPSVKPMYIRFEHGVFVVYKSVEQKSFDNAKNEFDYFFDAYKSCVDELESLKKLLVEE